MRLRTLHELDKTEGTVQLRNASTSDASSLVLFPRPSPTDPNDPLRWPRWKKHVAFLSVCAFTFLTNYGIGGLAPAFYILSLEFDKSMAQTSDLLLWYVKSRLFPTLHGHFGGYTMERAPPRLTGVPGTHPETAWRGLHS